MRIEEGGEMHFLSRLGRFRFSNMPAVTYRFAAAHPRSVVIGGYVLLTAAFLWPVVLEFRNGVPHDLGDPLLNTWIADWNLKTTAAHSRLVERPRLLAALGGLAFSEHLLGHCALRTAQVARIGPQASYNLVLTGSWPLAATAGYTELPIN